MTLNSSAAVRYVDAGSTNPTPPYTNWATASLTIQDAIDAAVAGDQILVTNGVYQSGGKIVYGSMMNRVAVTKPVTVRSINGPQVTVIRGYPVIGNSAVRCVYLTNGAMLVGFTLTNGATRNSGDASRERSGGGLSCESTNVTVLNCIMGGNLASDRGGGANSGSLSNCTLTGNYSGLYGGGASSCNLNNCVVSSNSALRGGGTSFATLNNCTVNSNSAAQNGGGAYSSTLANCTLNGNSALSGGGANGGTLNNCTLSGNSASGGGGAADSTLNNCTISGNLAGSGGGANGGTLKNCVLNGNSSSSFGGGAVGGSLIHCTLTGNSARIGGGSYEASLLNCVVYYNTASIGSNYAASTLAFCCSSPLPKSGIGNIADEPGLASSFHLSPVSSCRGAGTGTSGAGVDIDGEAWANPPSIGCDEYYSGAVTGLVSVAIQAGYTNAANGFDVGFAAEISGHVSASRWDFGDGTVVSNRPYLSHGWSYAGDYAVTLRAFNENHPDGVSATVTVHVVEQPVHYVDLNNTNPFSPYTTWVTAATNIQDAVDTISVPGALVLVADGIYSTGGRVVWGALTNRVAVNKPVTVRSVNGSKVTTIQGYQVPGTTNGDAAIRCVYLTNGAALVGFTLTNGATRTVGDSTREQSGGALWCESLAARIANCVLSGNSAKSNGGGSVHGALNNCTLSGNSAQSSGGGAYLSSLNNCTLINNSSQYDGGVSFGTLNNCIVYYNTSGSVANYSSSSTLNYCCTTPKPLNGTGNILSPPIFIDQPGSNLRLQSYSPCINSGFNGHAPAGSDLDGNSRIVGGTVDMGAFEFQSPTSVLSYAWLQQYGLPTDGSVDYSDSDTDQLNNWQEWISGTNPTNSLSVLRLLSPTNSVSGVTVSWESVSGRNYFLESGTDLGAQPLFLLLKSNIVGQASTTSYTDTNAIGDGPFFYRVGVQQ